MKPKNFFGELKRRNVYKVAVAYAIVGWLLVQIATQVFPFLEIPNWVVRLVIVLVAIGFPIALVIAWAFELTPEGLKRMEDVDLPIGGAAKKHTWIYVVIIGAAFSVGLFFIGRYIGRNTAGASATELSAKSIAVLPFDNLSRDPDNAFFAEGVQDEILTRLAKVADLKVISRTSTQRFKSAPSDLRDIAAYELYHKGRSLWGKRSGDNIPKAIAFYEEAIVRDPNYALAYAGLAQAYILLPFYSDADRLDAYSKAKDAAVKALRLDSN